MYIQGVQKINFTYLNVNNVRTNTLIATPVIYIEETCRIILVPNTMLLAILKFNYSVNYVKRKKHISILRSKIDVWLTMF